MGHAERGAVVEADGIEPVVVEGERLTFGRSPSCDIGFDEDDRGISRLAGAVERVDGTWFVVNHSRGRPLAIVDRLGFRTVVPPGGRVAVVDRVSVVVEGQVRRHQLVVTVGDPVPPGEPVDDDGAETEMGAGVTYSAEDRLALVALFAGYLEGFPRHDPRPRTYAGAATRLGWTRTSLVKRVEYLRIRLDRAGVPNLHGERALEALAEHVIATGIITSGDLASLPGNG